MSEKADIPKPSLKLSQRLPWAQIIAVSVILAAYFFVKFMCTLHLPKEAIEALADIIANGPIQSDYDPDFKSKWVCLIDYTELTRYLGRRGPYYMTRDIPEYSSLSPDLREAIISRLKTRFVVYPNKESIPAEYFHKQKNLLPMHYLHTFPCTFAEIGCHNGFLFSYRIVQVDANTIKYQAAAATSCECSTGCLRGEGTYRWNGREWIALD